MIDVKIYYTFYDGYITMDLINYTKLSEFCDLLVVLMFRNDRSGSAATINRWVAEKTNNKVSEIVSEAAIDQLTRLILVNAIYFKGDWLEKFNANFTNDADFHVSPKESVIVKMMYLEDKKLLYGVNHELHCQAVELPYAGDTLSMFIILPDLKTTNLAEVEKKLSIHALINVASEFKMAKMEVELWLPRFHLDERLSLAEVLSGMGMKDLFTQGAADLSGVDGTKELYVSKVLHRAVVDVNEEGTEAAAATACVVHLLCYTEPNRFRADHPFLFFIQDRATKSILFIGRLAKPPAA